MLLRFSMVVQHVAKRYFLKLFEIIEFSRKVVVEIEAQSHFQPNSVTW